MSTFNSFIKKAHIVCSDEFLEDELSHIVNFGIDHGYNPQVINKLIEKLIVIPIALNNPVLFIEKFLLFQECLKD